MLIKLVLGIIASIAGVAIIGFHPTIAEYVSGIHPADAKSEAKMSLYVTFFGGLGGLIFSIQSRSLKLPEIQSSESEIDLGFVADILVGISGSFIIFLILPFDFNSQNQGGSGNQSGFEGLKIVATSILGGYAGRSLFKVAYGKLSMDIEQIQTSQKQLKTSQKEAQRQLREMSESQKKDIKVTGLLNKYLDNTANSDERNELLDSIKTPKELPPDVRIHIFSEVKKFRMNAWYRMNDRRYMYSDDENKLKPTNENFILERRQEISLVIPILEALIQSMGENDKDKDEQVYAELAFALKDSAVKNNEEEIDNYKKAKKNIEKAIEIRDKNEKKGYVVYEYNRALYNIKLMEKKAIEESEKNKRKILADLVKVSKDSEFCERLIYNEKKVQNIPEVKKWLNKYSSCESFPNGLKTTP